jgi:hydroxymethylbilane synthase
LSGSAPRLLRLGTRGSMLARLQSEGVARRLQEIHPGLEIDPVVIRTRADREPERPLAPLGGKGVFVREIEEALLAGEIDLAVHSLKDLPIELPQGLEVAAVPERIDPADALVSPGGVELEALPAGARIGTGSPRRAALLRVLRPDVRAVPLRGNVDTRLKRLEEGRCEAMILAIAGLTRIGRLDSRARRLDPRRFVPAPGQGALAIETRRDSEAASLVRPLLHPASATCVAAEQALVAALGGGCQLPLGALATLDGARLRLVAFLADPRSGRSARAAEEGEGSAPGRLAEIVARRLLEGGGREILAALSEHPPPGGADAA